MAEKLTKTIIEQTPDVQVEEVSDTQRWPVPLPEALPPVAPFDFDLLPQSLRPWAEDIYDRVGCPADFIGVALMVALAGVVRRQIGIRPQEQTDWCVVPNMWGLVIGRPGVLKSPAMEAAIAPLKRLQAQARETFKQEHQDYLQQLKVAKLRNEAAEKVVLKQLRSDPEAVVTETLVHQEPDEVYLTRFLANDATAAALGELLRQNPAGLMVYRDEIVSLLRSLDRDGEDEARGFYLTAWNGDSSYTFDRIGRGLDLYIPAVCISILGSTQPGRISEYLVHAVRGGKGDDGLMQRFGLLVWPDKGSPWKEVDRLPETKARQQAHGVFDRLNALRLAEFGAQSDQFDPLPFVRFDPDALERFRAWRSDLETLLRGETLHPALEAHLAKYRKLIPGLALLIHLADAGDPPAPAVGETAVLMALAWADYLQSHAQRAYSSVIFPDVRAARAILAKVRKQELPTRFVARDVYRHHWTYLADRERVVDALRLLTDYDYLDARVELTGGRSREVYEVNPLALIDPSGRPQEPGLFLEDGEA